VAVTKRDGDGAVNDGRLGISIKGLGFSINGLERKCINLNIMHSKTGISNQAV
jgi:hypothetical protein